MRSCARPERARSFDSSGNLAIVVLCLTLGDEMDDDTPVTEEMPAIATEPEATPKPVRKTRKSAKKVAKKVAPAKAAKKTSKAKKAPKKAGKKAVKKAGKKAGKKAT